MRIAFLIPVLVTLAGCGDGRPMASYPIEVAAAGATSAELRFEYEGGVLMIQPMDPASRASQGDAASPGESDPVLLMDAKTDHPDLRPKVESTKVGDALEVRVHQPTAKAAFGKRSRNEWRAAVDPRIPLDARIDAGVLGGTFHLGGLLIERFSVKANQGELDFDFTLQPVTTSTELLVELGHGYVRVRVPRGVPTRVRSREAVGKLIVEGIPEVSEGEYADGDFEGAEVRIDITLGVMMGQLLVERVSASSDGLPEGGVDK